MDDQERVHGLARLLAATARAHHEATGGANDDWATWYATELSGDIDGFVGYAPQVAEIAGWLTRLDEQQRSENPDGRWPQFYAERIVERYAKD